MPSQTGAMTKKVMNSDRPMMIWLPGEPCNCSAERTKPSTMATRVKQVISSRIEGASDSSVMVKRILMPLSTSGAPLFGLSEIESGPRLVVAVFVCAWAAKAPNRKNKIRIAKCRRENIKHSTFNNQHPRRLRAGLWAFDVECCMLNVCISLFFQHLCQRLCERHRAGGFFRGLGCAGFGFRQMAQQIHAGGRGGDEEALFFVAHDKHRLPRAERTGFEDVQFRLLAALECEPLPVFEKPRAAEKKPQHERERAGDTQQRNTRFRKRRRGDGRVGGFSKKILRREQNGGKAESPRAGLKSLEKKQRKFKDADAARGANFFLAVHATSGWPTTSVIFTP